jgi:hypothetical protein
METLDHNTLVTATGGYGWYGGSPPFVPEGYAMHAPRWAAAAYEGYAPYPAMVPIAPMAAMPAMPARWYRSGRW